MANESDGFISLVKIAISNQSGRFNRREFAIVIFGLPLVFILLFMPILSLDAFYDGVLPDLISLFIFIWILLLLLLMLIIMVASLGTYVLRLHDLDLSGWFVLLIFIPYVDILVFSYLLLKEGKGIGETRWG